MFKRTKKNARRLLMITCIMHWFTIGQIVWFAYLASCDRIPFTFTAVCMAVVLCVLWGFWLEAWLAAVEIKDEIAANEREMVQK